MACFIVPAAEAIVTTIAAKVIEKKENEQMTEMTSEGAALKQMHHTEMLSKKLNRLNGLLWGGSALLAFEHAWHGEIQPFFPFLTAASNPANLAEVLHEMSTVGVAMAVSVTVIWGALTCALEAIDRRTMENTVSTVTK